jgi:hypothetical protein
MATAYEAVVRFYVEGVAAGDDEAVTQRLRAALPAGAVVALARVDDDLAADIRLLLDGNDASEVQIEARDLCFAALERAGLTDRVGDIADVDVRASS